MMKKETFTESVSLDQERMLKYKTFAVVFSYPDSEFFSFFPGFQKESDKMCLEYDKLFRASELWLYGTEYISTNVFQKSKYLADIMGFYKAFGLEPGSDRPDLLSSELEFMHFLIFKKINALKTNGGMDLEEKIFVCEDAQKKFFSEYLLSSVQKISEAVISKSNNDFYKEAAVQLLEFLESEKIFFDNLKL